MARGIPASGKRKPPGPLRPENREISEFVGYDPDDGLFWWKRSPGRCRPQGSSAGTIWRRGSSPRLIIAFRGRGYRAARVAWLIMTGEWPSALVDHADGNSLNDCWKNLRRATKSQNNSNTSRRRDNTSGFKGVTRKTGERPYEARIQHDGKRIALGRFETAERAHAAYCEAMAKFHGDFGRPS